MSGLRIGHTEREAASRRLSDHFAKGRLDDEEYAERLDAAWSARTDADLALLFHDLPAQTVAASRPRRPNAQPVARIPRRGSSSLPALLVLAMLAIGGLLVAAVPGWLVVIGVLVLAKVLLCRGRPTCHVRS